jgi:hypothetical protein
MRLERMGGSPEIPGTFRPSRMGVGDVPSFNAVWAANTVAVGTAALYAGLGQQWVAFGVTLALALAFLWMQIVMDFKWDDASDKTIGSDGTPLALAGLPEETLLPVGVRTSWWFRVALGLWLAWAVFSTVKTIALAVDHHWVHYGWLEFAIAVISAVFSWLLLAIAWIGIDPPELPDLPDL